MQVININPQKLREERQSCAVKFLKFSYNFSTGLHNYRPRTDIVHKKQFVSVELYTKKMPFSLRFRKIKPKIILINNVFVEKWMYCFPANIHF